MRKALRYVATRRKLFHTHKGKVILGPHDSLKNCDSELYGDCTHLYGDADTIWGDCSQLKGDCTNIIGCCTNVSGNLDDCGITSENRASDLFVHLTRLTQSTRQVPLFRR
jgi:hypothetical protein